MANQNLRKIFLSASIPSPDRHAKYYETTDIIAIRDAVRALATVAIPKAHLIWGGHPSITPLIRYVMGKMNAEIKTHVTLYQSLFYERDFPQDNFSFENIVLTPKLLGIDASLQLMRTKMIEENDFKVGIFIGGMEGISTEYELFSKKHKDALILPMASTGGASKILFDAMPHRYDKRARNRLCLYGVIQRFAKKHYLNGEENFRIV